MSSNQEELESLATKVNVLTFLVIILVILLFLGIVGKCALAIFKLVNGKKKTQWKTGPDAVVVKGEKKKAKKSQKSKRSSRRKSSKSKATKKQPKSSKKSKANYAAAVPPLKSLKKDTSSKKTSKGPVKKAGDGKPATITPKPTASQTTTPVKTATGRALPTDVTSGVATETLIAHIPPQFAPNRRDSTTEQQIVDIPSQFQSPQTAKDSCGKDIRLTREQLGELAKQVRVYMSETKNSVSKDEDVVAPALLPPSIQSTQSPLDVNVSPSQSKEPPVVVAPVQPAPIVQQPQVANSSKPLADSVYMVGMN